MSHGTTILVTGSAGHLGEALMRTLPGAGHQAVGLDSKPSAFTHEVGSITDRAFVRRCMSGVRAVLHTATLHKPHIATHARQDFLDTNITGTLNLLEEAVRAGVGAFVFTSTTSTFGRALTPFPGAPAAWITEDVVPVPRNIYGVTKTAAENLCELFHRDSGLPCIILRTSRFFPEPDDRRETREAYADANLKLNELLYRRADLEDVVSAHLLAFEKAAAIRFGRYIISATTPFTRDDLPELRTDAPAVVMSRVPGPAARWRALSARRDITPTCSTRGHTPWPDTLTAYLSQCVRSATSVHRCHLNLSALGEVVVARLSGLVYGLGANVNDAAHRRPVIRRSPCGLLPTGRA